MLRLGCLAVDPKRRHGVAFYHSSACEGMASSLTARFKNRVITADPACCSLGLTKCSEQAGPLGASMAGAVPAASPPLATQAERPLQGCRKRHGAALPRLDEDRTAAKTAAACGMEEASDGTRLGVRGWRRRAATGTCPASRRAATDNCGRGSLRRASGTERGCGRRVLRTSRCSIARRACSFFGVICRSLSSASCERVVLRVSSEAAGDGRVRPPHAGRGPPSVSPAGESVRRRARGRGETKGACRIRGSVVR